MCFKGCGFDDSPPGLCAMLLCLCLSYMVARCVGFWRMPCLVMMFGLHSYHVYGFWADACLVHDLTICVSIACLTVAGAMLLAHGQCHDTYPCCEIYPYVSLADAKIHVFWAQVLC